MRPFFVFATLLFFAAPLAAQDFERPGPSASDVPVAVETEVDVDGTGQAFEEERVEVRAEAAGTLAEITRLQSLDLVGVQFERSDPAADAEAAMRQPDRRGWWWMVAGIVTAGVILAVIL